MFSSLLSFLFAASSITMSELPVSQVELIAKEVINELVTSTEVTPELVVMHRPEPTPLGAIRYGRGKCEVIVNTNPEGWAQWGRFLNQANKNDWKNIVRTAVAHEVGHCMPEHSIHLRSVELDTTNMNALSRIDREIGRKGLVILKQELFADTVALLYAKEFLTEEQANIVIASMIAARDSFGNKDPLHDTSREIRKLIAQNASRLPNETFGQAAVRLLSIP